MKQTSIVLVVFLIYVASAYIPNNDPEWCKQKVKREDCPTTPDDFNPVNDDDTVEVWYLQAPLFEGEFKNFFGELGAFHSALGFYDLSTGKNYTVEYDAFYEVANGTFANVVTFPNGTKDLFWCDYGILCAVGFINETYWNTTIFPTASRTYMATINGTLFNQFIKWMAEDNITHTQYQTFGVFDEWGGTEYLPSSTCDDFAWRGFQALYDMGVRYNCSVAVKRDFLNFYSTDPIPVEWNDTTTQEEIIQFYSDFHFSNESLTEVIVDLIKMAEEPKFIYADSQYYQLHLHWPFIGLKYAESVVPGCAANGGEDKAQPTKGLASQTARVKIVSDNE